MGEDGWVSLAHGVHPYQVGECIRELRRLLAQLRFLFFGDRDVVRVIVILPFPDRCTTAACRLLFGLTAASNAPMKPTQKTNSTARENRVVIELLLVKRKWQNTIEFARMDGNLSRESQRAWTEDG